MGKIEIARLEKNISILGIIAHVGYHWLSILVERMVFRMENSAIEFMDILQDN